jgi:hypothetical protein
MSHGYRFHWRRKKFLVIYLDEIIVFSRSDREHCEHLSRVFLK